VFKPGEWFDRLFGRKASFLTQIKHDDGTDYTERGFTLNEATSRGQVATHGDYMCVNE
jgi:hypothetical protein